MRKSKRGQNDRSFQPSAAGKGCGDRTTDVDTFRRNFDDINWGRKTGYAAEWARNERHMKRLGAAYVKQFLVSPPFDSHTRGP